MVNPTPGYGITTPYRKTGKYWSLGWHTGADLAGGQGGTPIVSATPGKVIAANAYDKAYGYKTIIRWGSFDLWYCHMPSGAARVKVGQTVSTGQRIGTIGATGNVTGPHLHLEMRVKGGGFSAANFRNPSTAINYDATMVAKWGQPATWVVGSTGADVTRLGKQLQLWAAHYKLAAPYKTGPGPIFTETDRAAVKAFQMAQGWTGSAADGLPGAETFKRLADTPPVSDVEICAVPTPDPEPETPMGTYFRILAWNQYADQYTGSKRDIGPQQAVYDDAAPSVALVTEVNRDTDHERWMRICGGWPKVYAIRAKRNNHIYFQQGVWEYVAATEKLLGSTTGSGGKNQNRGATFAVLRHKETGILQSFVSTHLTSATSGYTATDADRSRKAEARNLMKYVNTKNLIEGWDADTAIIGGDLNDASTSAGSPRAIISDTHGFLRDHGIDVTNANVKTFQGWPNPSKWRTGSWIDDIASGPGIRLVSARVVTGHKGASDHLAQVASYYRTTN